MKKILTIVLAGLLLAACTAKEKPVKKSLVVYYSVTATTQKAAECRHRGLANQGCLPYRLPADYPAQPAGDEGQRAARNASTRY